MYIIEDWAGNVLDYKGSFKSPELAVPMEFISWDYAEDYLNEIFEKNKADPEVERGEYCIKDKE